MITNATHITLECLILMGKVGFNQHIELGVPNFNIYSSTSILVYLMSAYSFCGLQTEVAVLG